MDAQRTRPRRQILSGVPRVARIAIPSLLLACVTLIAFLYARTAEEQHVRLRFDQQAEELAAEIRRGFDLELEYVLALRRFYDSSTFVEREEFHTLVVRDLERAPGLRALEWVPRVPASQRYDYERAAREAGYPNFRFKRFSKDGIWVVDEEPWSDEYFPVFYLEPVKGNEPAMGIDLASEPRRQAALNAARDSGEPTATAPLDLIQAAQQGSGILIFVPVYEPRAKLQTVQQRREHLQGHVVGVIRVPDAVSAYLARSGDLPINVMVKDAEHGLESPVLFRGSSGSDDEPVSDLLQSASYVFATRTWEFQFSATDEFVAMHRPWWSWYILFGGLLLSCAAGWFSWDVVTRLELTAELAEQRSRELARSQGELQFAREVSVVDQSRTNADQAANGTSAPDVIDPFRSAMEHWAYHARVLIGAHQAAVSYIPRGSFSAGYHVISLSEKYEQYRSYDVPPSGEGIWTLLIETKQTFCLTDEQLKTHPQWRNFGNKLDERGLEHPPMRGWLAVPVYTTGRDYVGVVQLSDKYAGDFTSEDLETLKRLAHLVEPAFSLHYMNEELVENGARLAEANAQLIQSNEELQRFAYVASHDLQVPLRNIAGFSQLLEMDYAGKLDDRADAWITQIVDGTIKMRRLIENLMEYSRVETRSQPFETVRFGDVFDDAVATLASSIRDAGAIVTCGDLPVLRGDHWQLTQLMTNLIGNGIKYRSHDAPRVHVAAEQSGETCVISVQDNGIGIDPAYHNQVFEVFRRLHAEEAYPGTGIGLSICRRVVQRHGGEIWIESAEGQGAKFLFTLPVESSARD